MCFCNLFHVLIAWGDIHGRPEVSDSGGLRFEIVVVWQLFAIDGTRVVVMYCTLHTL